MQFEDESGFLRELARNPLPAALLVAGVDELRVIEAADAVRAKARTEGFERTAYDVDGRFDWDTLVGDFSAMSLFASRRLLDVRSPDGKLGKDGSEAIASFCKDPPPGTSLLVSCMDWNKKLGESAWARALGKSGHVLAMWATQRHKLPDWLLARMRARGIDASPEAAELLANRVEGNLLAAAQEVEKLQLLLAPEGGGERPAGRPRRVTVEDMERLVADSARFDVFKLADALLAGDAARGVRILRALRAEGEAVPGLIGPVLSQLVQLAQVSSEVARGGDARAAMRNRGVWDSKQPPFKRALERHDAARWEGFAIEAGRIERMSKGRETGDPWIALERLLAAVAVPKARKLVAM